MIASDTSVGIAMLSKWRCNRGLISMLPAVGFNAATYWHFSTVFIASLLMSFSARSPGAAAREMADCVLYLSSSGRLKSSMK